MNEIIIDVGLNEDRVAILENGQLVELFVEREDNKRIVGNIYKGRVVNVLPGMQAAFVDIGLEKNAFLYVKDAIPKEILSNSDINLKDISIKDVVKQGQEIIVQVIKEPFGGKGARITTHITLPGRHLVLMPYTDYIGVSRRITSETERERLRLLAQEIKPDNMGIIIRTASEGITVDDFKDDIKFLLKVFTKINNERNLGFAPRTIYRDLDLIHRTVRDIFTDNIKRLIVNDRTKYNSIVELVDLISPHLKSKLEYFDGSHDLFGYLGINSMINQALERKVWLKSGGYIIIDETEALTSIDVNTGKYVGNINLEDTVLTTNMEAVKEIAKQLRLRNIGGIIIIDFIDMNDEEGEKLILSTLENELKKDRIKATILGMTQLGLVEMTRKKARNRMTANFLKSCPCCEGTGKVYSEETILKEIEREVKRISLHTNSEAVLIEINENVQSFIYNNYKAFLDDLEKKYGIKVITNPHESIHHNEIKVKFMGKLEKVRELIANK